MAKIKNKIKVKYFIIKQKGNTLSKNFFLNLLGQIELYLADLGVNFFIIKLV